MPNFTQIGQTVWISIRYEQIYIYCALYIRYSKETEKSFFIYQLTRNQMMKNQIFTNLTKHKQIFAKGQKADIELLGISYNFSLFPILHWILLYLFTNILLNFCSMSLVFSINEGENSKLFI